ncbi:hypothetical protein Peur_003303 [Populus x canadensis]
MHACIINGLNNLEPLLVRQILLSACNYHRRIDQYVHNILDHLRLPDPFTWGCTLALLDISRSEANSRKPLISVLRCRDKGCVKRI